MIDQEQMPPESQRGVPVPDDVLEELDREVAEAGGEWSEPEEYQGAAGRTMFDLPSSEDNTVTVLLPGEDISAVPSQALVRVRSVRDGRVYRGIVVKGPFAEPDGLRGDSPLVITTAVRGGIFMPRYHGRVQVELIGEELDGVLVPPRLRPLPNSPVFVLDAADTSATLRLSGDIELGVPVGYDELMAAIPSDKKSVLPRHVGILGTTGGGKSTTVSGLIAGFQQTEIATVVFDTEGEYTQIYQPTDDPTMLATLEKRGRVAAGVKGVRVYYLVGRETTCPDPRRTREFSLQFSQLSPYLVMEVLDLNDAQQQRYQKAYDIARRLLRELHIFPTNAEELAQLIELDELETGYPRLTVEHMYDIVRVCGDFAAGEKDIAELRNPVFKKHRERVIQIIQQEEIQKNPGSWRIVQGRLGQLLRLRIFDNPSAAPLDYDALTEPGRVTVIDLSDSDSPQLNNLVIAELLRGLQSAQNENYRRAETEGTIQRRTMVVIEEAHEFLSSERIKQMPVLFQQVARIARRGRKRWLGMVFVTQLPQHLPDEVLGLINNFILHKIADANVISRLKRSLGGVDGSLWQRVPGLAPGQALVSMASFARPLLVNINPTPCRLRMVE